MNLSITFKENIALRLALMGFRETLMGQLAKCDLKRLQQIKKSYDDYKGSKHVNAGNEICLIELLDNLIDKQGIAENKDRSKKGDKNFSQVAYDIERTSNHGVIKSLRGIRPYEWNI